MKNQGGWVGVIALLLVVLIIGFLASGTLKQYGLIPKLPSFNAGAGPGTGTGADPIRERAVSGSGMDQSDPSPGDSMERVRRLQNTVRRQAEDMDERIDRSSK